MGASTVVAPSLCGVAFGAFSVLKKGRACAPSPDPNGMSWSRRPGSAAPSLPRSCPPPGGTRQGEEHPWVAKRVACVQHLARKCWLLRKHGTFHPRSGLSVFWGGGKGLPVTSTQVAAFFPCSAAAPASRGGRRHLAALRRGSSGLCEAPPEPGSPPRDGNCFLRRSTGSRGPFPEAGGRVSRSVRSSRCHRWRWDPSRVFSASSPASPAASTAEPPRQIFSRRRSGRFRISCPSRCRVDLSSLLFPALSSLHVERKKDGEGVASLKRAQSDHTKSRDLIEGGEGKALPKTPARAPRSPTRAGSHGALVPASALRVASLPAPRT